MSRSMRAEYINEAGVVGSLQSFVLNARLVALAGTESLSDFLRWIRRRRIRLRRWWRRNRREARRRLGAGHLSRGDLFLRRLGGGRFSGNGRRRGRARRWLPSRARGLRKDR